MARLVRVAASPDPDDAFMMCGLAKGLFDDDRFKFELAAADVETLNAAAMQEVYDVTAVSAAAFPRIAHTYVVLNHGASFGEGYGPVVVAAREVPDPRKARIASPGARTTAWLVLRLAWGDTNVVHAPFDRIPGMVRRGEVDLGLLIHEGQVTFAREGLRLVLDLGEWWRETTHLPLPLGIVVANRALGEDLPEISRRVRASIEWGLENRAEALLYARGFGRGIADADLDRFVAMYVTERTREMGEEGRRAVTELLSRGAAGGYLPEVEVEFHD